MTSRFEHRSNELDNRLLIDMDHLAGISNTSLCFFLTFRDKRRSFARLSHLHNQHIHASHYKPDSITLTRTLFLRDTCEQYHSLLADCPTPPHVASIRCSILTTVACYDDILTALIEAINGKNLISSDLTEYGPTKHSTISELMNSLQLTTHYYR